MDVCMLVANDARRDPRVQKEARSLVKAGWSVAVIALTKNEAETGWEEAEGGYRVHRIRPEGFTRAAIKKRLSAVAPEAYDVLIRELRKWRRLPEPRRDAPDPSLSAEERERRARRNGMIAAVRTHHTQSRMMAQAAILTAPQVVHAHDLNTLLAASWAARVTGAALVFDSHEIFWEQLAPGIAPDEWVEFFRELQIALVPSVSRFMTVCDSIADWFADLHRIPKPAVVRNSIELPSGFAPQIRERPPSDPIEVLFHGGYSINRGLEELIEAAPLLVNARLVLRGFGPLEAKLRAIVEEKRLSHVVQFAEPVPMNEVVEAASTADIGVIPYKPVCLNNRFSTPNKLFEYMNAGVAIAASDLPEIARIVKGEEIGSLFDPMDPRSIARAINELASDRTRLLEMRRRSRRAAELRHHWGVDEQVLLDLYRGLLPRSAADRFRRITSGR
jgi:glycosyltransferase involved in cell wall biosynthesis